MKKIVLMGFDFECPNKGCEALSYAFMSVIQKVYHDEEVEISNLTHKDSLGIFPDRYPDVRFIHYRAAYKSVLFYFKLMKCFKNADVIFDITYGDSFSDIYGTRWLLKTNIFKQLAVMSGTPLVLLPQTYGPFVDDKLRKWSFHLIKKAYTAFSRDKLSSDYVKRESGVDVKTVTDLAFELPYDKDMFSLQGEKIRIGFNVSSLLWERADQFELKTDYRKYCCDLIQTLEETGNYEIHLIAHVIEEKDNAPENDMRTCRILHDKFPDTILAPVFLTPIEAKSYIHHMDIFIGARMHATIGAFSSGVVTIPFAYSRKFQGLYEGIGYPYFVDATKNSTDEAIEKTIGFINMRDKLSETQDKSLKSITDKLNSFKNNLMQILDSH